jgi:hypothetical protein
MTHPPEGDDTTGEVSLRHSENAAIPEIADGGAGRPLRGAVDDISGQ